MRNLIVAAGILLAEGCFMPASKITLEETQVTMVSSGNMPVNPWEMSFPPLEVMKADMGKILQGKTFGEQAAKENLLKNTLDSHKKRNEEAKKFPFHILHAEDFIGLEKVDFISPVLLKQFLLDFLDKLPKSWTHKANVKGIVFAPIDQDYSYSSNRAVGLYRKDGYIQIDLDFILSQRLPRTQFLIYLTTVLLHETAHAGMLMGQLSEEEIVKLFFMATSLYLDESRPKFSYPENINTSVSSGHNEAILLKIHEYFAILIGDIALKIPAANREEWLRKLAETLQKNHGASKEMALLNAHFVNKYFEIFHPDFEPWKSFWERKQLIVDLEGKLKDQY